MSAYALAQECKKPFWSTKGLLNVLLEVESKISIALILLTILIKVYDLLKNKFRVSEMEDIKQKLILANRNLNGDDPKNIQSSLETYREIQTKIEGMNETSLTLSCKAAILGKLIHIYRGMGEYDECLECKMEAMKISTRIKEILANKARRLD